MHGGSRGETSHIAHSVLLKDLQGLGAFATSCQHHLWLQGERGHLSAGKMVEEGRRGGRKTNNTAKNMTVKSISRLKLVTFGEYLVYSVNNTGENHQPAE